MAQPYSLSESQLNRLFPFYILINRELNVAGMGRSMVKLLGWEGMFSFNQCFSIPRPYTPIKSFEDLLLLLNQLVVLESTCITKLKFRGQFEFMEEAGGILFVGSPWFGSMEQVTENKLVIEDFARHDPLIDLLHVLKSQEITTEDLKQLVATINIQKEELKKANKEVHDIALFPTQNPDPLIRINFNGDVLQNNPAAAKLDFFEFENKVYRNDEFFTLLAGRLNINQASTTIEARSDNRDYSFLCVTMKEEGYINFYGRDITEQKNNRQQLERLSMVASANNNGVLFVSTQGKITWANEGFCKLSGYSLNEIIGRSPVELCNGPLSDKAVLKDILDSFFQGRGFSSEIIYYRKDKSWFWGRSVSQPVINADGNITEFFGIIQDVTEEKANAEKLKVLSQIAEDNINAVVIADKDGKITWVNKSFTSMTGFTLEESFGKKPGDLLQGPETDKKTVQYLSTQIKKGEPFNTEIINYSKSGARYWLRVQGQPIKNKNGEVTGFFALEEDITNEKESEQRFRKALESIGDNVWEHDFKTGKTYFSKSENEFLGYHTGELSDNQHLWWNSVYEEDRHLMVENDRKYKKALIDSHNLEYRILHKNGSVKWVLDRGVVIEKDRDGKPLKITGTHTDITGRKEFEEKLKSNEEKYRGIIANMNLGLMEMDIHGKITFANQSLLKMTGISENESVGFDSFSFLAPESRAEVKERSMHRPSEISEAYEVQTNIKGKQGWWFVSSAPKFTVTGDFIGSIVICLDISNQKKLEKELIKSREQAEQLAKAKEIFLANMSHEIRTPMNAIMGMGNQLAKTSLSEQQYFYLNTINTAAENLLVIINDILDLSKIEAGKLTVEKIGFEPKKVVGNAIQVLMHKAEEKGLKLSNSYCDKQLSSVLIGDPYRLNQVLLNLISNAVKFTEKGSVDVTCSVVKDTATTQTIEAKVIDTGIGMDKEFAERLFDKFSQEYESVSRRYGGTGLGMSICKELIELMGGKIVVESKKGKGTTVLFSVTFNKGTEKDIEHKMAIDISEGFLRGRTILVADDNEMNRLVASTILESYGATVLEASNGEEVLQLLESKGVELILLDIQMPVLNGYDTVRMIRKKQNSIPVIALTANAIKGENKKCIDAGMNDYIAKPFREKEFLAKIAHWLKTDITENHPPIIAVPSEASTLYDLSSLKEISKGNQAFIEKMVRLFCDQTPPAVAQMEAAFKEGNTGVMSALAHKLKPSIDNLKINTIKTTIRNIELAGKQKQSNEDLAAQIAEVKQVIEKTILKLKQEFPS